MAMLVQCPNPACKASCSVAEAFGGRPFKCPKCGKPFVVKPTADWQKSDTNHSQPSSNANPFPVLPAEFGRYRILKLLGRGGMGAVYLAQDSQLGRQVALKVPFFNASESPQRVERFVREARSAAMLDHPNICTVFDAGQINGRPFITMAYIAGTPLEEEIDPEVPMPQLRAAEIARKIALALEHAHRKGTIHRDLKPANVMMAASGEPVVMDFGLAKRVADVDPKEAKLTRDGGLLGTPSYMAPEQCKGDVAAIGPATDVYSLGVMLFEMLTGKTPYTGAMSVVIGRILTSPVPPVREFRPDVDARLDAICRKSMAKEPADRFASMAEFADAIGRYLKAPSASSPSLPAPPIAAVVKAPAPVVGRSPFDDLEAATPPKYAPKKAKREQVATARPPRKKEPIIPGAAAFLLSRWQAALSRKKWPILAGAAACVLLAGLAALWASGVFKVKTADGVLVVQVNEPNAEVFVDGDRMTVTWSDGGKKAEIHVKPGTRKVEVKKDGFSVDGTDLTFRDGDRVVFTARLVPEPHVAKADQPPPEKPPPPAPKNPDAPPVAGAADDDQGFTPLFNGKDITDWLHEGDARQWTVEGGAIVGQSDDWKTETHLLSNKQYADFTLRLEFMVDPGSKGAIDLRALFAEQIYPFTRAHPLFALSDPAKFPGDPSGTTHWVKDDQMTGSKPAEDLQLPAGSWHGLKITVRGDACIGILEGKKIVDIRLDPQSGEATIPALKRAKGRIGFQANTGTIRFRHIEIKELTPADAAAPPAPAADGFVPLFNGKDLTGWVADGDCTAAEWKADASGIAITGGPQTTWGFLLSKQDYTSFVLRLQFQQMTEGAKSGIVLRGVPGLRFFNNLPYQCKVNLQNPENTGAVLWSNNSVYQNPTRPAKLKAAGEWNDLEVELRGQSLRATVNGECVQTMDLDAFAGRPTALPVLKQPSGRIGLQKHQGNVCFRNIEIKELPLADAAAPPAPAADGFVPLFNGKDLTGWAGLEDFWSVKDGVISGHETKEGSKQTDLVLTAMQPADFELHFSYKFATPEGNSGVQVRSKVLDEQTYRVGGCQADCDAKGDYDGSFYDEAGARGTMSNRGEKTVWDAGNQRHNEKLPESGDELKKVLKVGDWNDCVIVAQGDHITYTINGHLTTELTDDSPKALKEGVIALQLHAGFTMEVLFKDIKIKMLPPPKPEDQGFVPLFNGKDLTGWQVFDGKEEVWAVEDGLLVTKGGGGGWLMTEKEYADFEVRLEFKLSEECNSGVALRAPLTGDPSFQGMEIQLLDDAWYLNPAHFKGLKPVQLTGAIYGVVPPSRKALKPLGEWNTIRITARGRQVTVELNGVKTIDANLDDYKQNKDNPGLRRDKGRLGLQSHTNRAEFRNIEIKELK